MFPYSYTIISETTYMGLETAQQPIECQTTQHGQCLLPFEKPWPVVKCTKTCSYIQTCWGTSGVWSTSSQFHTVYALGSQLKIETLIIHREWYTPQKFETYRQCVGHENKNVRLSLCRSSQPWFISRSTSQLFSFFKICMVLFGLSFGSSNIAQSTSQSNEVFQ